MLLVSGTVGIGGTSMSAFDGTLAIFTIAGLFFVYRAIASKSVMAPVYGVIGAGLLGGALAMGIVLLS